MSLIQEIQRLVKRECGKVASMIRRGILRLATAEGMVQVEGYNNERFDLVELWQQFGLETRPPAGSEVLVVLIDASGDHPIAFATRSRDHRPDNLASGDAALYAAKDGGDQARIHVKAAGDVDLQAPASGRTVNVGGDDEFLLKGETVKTAIEAMLTAVAAPDVVDISTMKGAIATLTTTGWLATKGKVT